MKSELLSKIISVLCFVAIILSFLSVVFFFYGVIESDMLAQTVVYVEVSVVILHKVYTLILEKRILGNSLSAQLRKNSFIRHDNVYTSITDEINRVYIIVCLLLGITFVLLSLISGYLMKLISVYVLTVVVLYLIKLIIFYKSIGKILDYDPVKDNYSFIRGYAKLFFLEYYTTKFKRDHSIYKNYVYKAYSKGNSRQDLCVKSTLYFEVKYQIKHERAKWMLVLLFVVINTFILFYNNSDKYITDIIDNYQLSFLAQVPVKQFIVFVSNTMMCLISATTLLRYHYTCNYVKKILDNLKNDNTEERYNAYRRIDKKKSDYKKIRGLGLLAICIDRGYRSDGFYEKELLYRPLLRHHLRMPIKEFLTYMAATVLSLLMFFINILNITGIIVLIGCTVSGLLLLYFVVTPMLKKTVIKSMCKKLEENLDKEDK